MHTFSPKQKTSRQPMSAAPGTPDWARPQQARDVSSVIRLQRAIGNQAVQRLVEADAGGVERAPSASARTPSRAAVARQPSFAKAEGDPKLAPKVPEAPALAPRPQNEPTAPIPTPDVGVAGTVPDIRTPPGEGRQTAEEETVADVPSPGGVGNVLANIQLTFSQPKTDRLGTGKDDPVASGVTIGAFSQPGGRAVSPFGGEFYEPAFTGISYAFAGGKCTITATLDVVCPWGTNSGGRTDVPTATDPVVTKANWAAIKADLEPAAASPFKSPRTHYYSQSLVERHEQFHGTDDNAWTTASGLGIVKTFIEAATIAPGSAAADVPVLLDGARVKLIAENLTWYKGGGASHDSYAGEIRAYTDGKAAYKKLADDVETHGKTLP
jgi:hypothetical protein